MLFRQAPHRNCLRSRYIYRTGQRGCLLCLQKSPPQLVANEAFKNLCDEISCTIYQPCSDKEVVKQSLALVAACKVNWRRILTELNEIKVKPSMPTDIWRDTDVTVMDLFLYYIDDD